MTEDLIFKCYEHIVACIINNYFCIYLLVLVIFSYLVISYLLVGNSHKYLRLISFPLINSVDVYE